MGMVFKTAPADPSLDRYSRQVFFPGIGEAGQERLRVAHVALAGCGATGAAAAGLLARAGVGTLTLLDATSWKKATYSARCSSTKPMPASLCPRRKPPGEKSH